MNHDVHLVFFQHPRIDHGGLGRRYTEEDIRHGVKPYKAVGCSKCNAGYRGRTGIYQIMPISDAMETLILEGGNTQDLEKQAQAEGIMNLRQSGIEKVKQGITSIEELNRVTRD